MVEVDAKCIHHLILINLDTLNKFKIDYVRRECVLRNMYDGNIFQNEKWIKHIIKIIIIYRIYDGILNEKSTKILIKSNNVYNSRRDMNRSMSQM